MSDEEILAIADEFSAIDDEMQPVWYGLGLIEAVRACIAATTERGNKNG
jgi:hypothetical protein